MRWMDKGCREGGVAGRDARGPDRAEGPQVVGLWLPVGYVQSTGHEVLRTRFCTWRRRGSRVLWPWRYGGGDYGVVEATL